MTEDDKVRLGGMALSNGVLVHGPTAWACAVRSDDGEIKVASGRKRLFAPGVTTPFLRGPLRLAESFAFLPELRRRLPEARLPFERPAVLAATLASAVTVQVVRRSSGLSSDRARARLRARSRSRPRCSRCAAASSPPTTAPSTSRSGRTSTASERAKEHERCGSHLIGPLLAATAAGNVLAVAGAGAAPRHGARRAARSAPSARRSRSSRWMTRHPDHPLARALAKPGHELQHRIATAEPSPEQLEVAEAALAACLELEDEHGDRATD